jgi:hypothetical protein
MQTFMEEALYRVIITGHPLGCVSRHHAISAFANLFSISYEEAILRFHHAPCVVRGRLNQMQAEKYCRVMQRMGIQCGHEADESTPEPPGIYPRLRD